MKILAILTVLFANSLIAAPVLYKAKKISGTISHATWRDEISLEIITSTIKGQENISELINLVPHVMMVLDNPEGITSEESVKFTSLFLSHLPPIDYSRERIVKKN